VSKLVDVRKCYVLETLETKKERWCFDVYNHETKDHWLLATETEVEKNQVLPSPEEGVLNIIGLVLTLSLIASGWRL
jgi:hypothetical protein